MCACVIGTHVAIDWQDLLKAPENPEPQSQIEPKTKVGQPFMWVWMSLWVCVCSVCLGCVGIIDECVWVCILGWQISRMSIPFAKRKSKQVNVLTFISSGRAECWQLANLEPEMVLPANIYKGQHTFLLDFSFSGTAN